MRSTSPGGEQNFPACRSKDTAELQYWAVICRISLNSSAHALSTDRFYYQAESALYLDVKKGSFAFISSRVALSVLLLKFLANVRGASWIIPLQTSPRASLQH